MEPTLDLPALTGLLADQQDVAGAYVFGSTATGTASRASDVDVAVLLEGPVASGRRLELAAALQPAVEPRRLDLVILNAAPTTLAHRVLRDGRLVYERNPHAIARHREDTVTRYLDLAPLRRELQNGVRDRILEGRFGR